MTTATKESVSRVQDTVQVRQPTPETMAPPTVSGEEIKEMVNVMLQAAYERHLATPSQEMAEPLYWWDVVALGPVQPGAGLLPPTSFAGPLLPNQVIRVGQKAFVAAILLLNTHFPTTTLSAAELLSNFALPYEIEYSTGELKKWQAAPAYLQHMGGGNLTPNVPWAIDVFNFVAQDEGLYEMNISARIFGCGRVTAPPFSAYAHIVADIDADIFKTHPRIQVDQPIRFQVYR